MGWRVYRCWFWLVVRIGVFGVGASYLFEISRVWRGKWIFVRIRIVLKRFKRYVGLKRILRGIDLIWISIVGEYRRCL